MYRPENCIPLVLRHDDVDELLRGICTGVFLDLDVHLLLPLSWVGLPACLLCTARLSRNQYDLAMSRLARAVLQMRRIPVAIRRRGGLPP